MRTAWKLFQIIWWSIEKLWNHLSVVLKPSRFFWNHLYHLRIPASSFWRNVPAGKELIYQLSVPMSTKWKWKCSWEAEKQVLCQRGSNVKKKKKIRRTFHTKWIKIEDCFGDSKTNFKKKYQGYPCESSNCISSRPSSPMSCFSPLLRIL